MAKMPTKHLQKTFKFNQLVKFEREKLKGKTHKNIGGPLSRNGFKNENMI